jgi:AcrR family transcriptional regulator
VIVGRRRLHDTDALLDVARDAILERGIAAVTMELIAERSHAPIGTLYHRFGSRDDLFARVWLRAQDRWSAGYSEALELPDPLEAVTEAARQIVRFSNGCAEDARLLATVRPRDVFQHASEETRQRRVTQNAAVGTLLDRVAKRLAPGSEVARSRVWMAAFDMPTGAVRRRLAWRQSLPAWFEQSVVAAARAVLADYAPVSESRGFARAE